MADIAMERKGKAAGGWAAVAHLGVVCEVDTLKMCLPAQKCYSCMFGGDYSTKRIMSQLKLIDV